MDNPSMARFIASIRALRISKLSISSAVTKAMLYASAVGGDLVEQDIPLLRRQLFWSR